MTYIYAPSASYRYSLKKGMSGTDVAALQLNLPNIIVDGDFGEGTENSVIRWQTDHGLDPVDGIAGGDTQKSLCIIKSTPAARRYELPVGLLKSLLANESGFYLAAFSYHPSDWGFDLGPYQNSIGPQGDPATQVSYGKSYNIKVMAEQTAKNIKGEHDKYLAAVTSQYRIDLGHSDQERFAWSLGLLSHNWPVASTNIYRYGHIWGPDNYYPGYDDSYQTWIVTASGGRLSTPREWVLSYVEKSTVYVKW